MSSESACQVARSWVKVGSLFSQVISGEVYDFQSVSPEYLEILSIFLYPIV
jgi:hypothetical protein